MGKTYKTMYLMKNINAHKPPATWFLQRFTHEGLCFFVSQVHSISYSLQEKLAPGSSPLVYRGHVTKYL
jgi:hypothetical protein